MTIKNSSSSYARILFRHLRLTQENCADYFAGTQVTYDQLMTLDGSISMEDQLRIYQNAIKISELDDLGLSVGSQLHLSAHGALGVAIFSSPDLGTGLQMFERFSQIRVQFFSIELAKKPGYWHVKISESVDLGKLRVFLTESGLSAVFSAITFFVGVGQFKGELKVAYPAPAYSEKYSQVFGNNVKFDAQETELIIPVEQLSSPSPVADERMHQEAVATCEALLRDIQESRSPETYVAKVSTLILANPGRIWTLNEVADKLHMSPRTLIRRLEGEGQKFQEIRDELAKNQAANLLTDSSLSVESVGYLMGFSDVSSFRRSFKRWFDETPSQYLERVRGV